MMRNNDIFVKFCILNCEIVQPLNGQCGVTTQSHCFTLGFEFELCSELNVNGMKRDESTPTNQYDINGIPSNASSERINELHFYMVVGWSLALV